MRLRTLVIICAAALLALGGLAGAAVRVYNNKFERKSDRRELDLAGKGCKAQVRGEKGQLRVTTPGGGRRCKLRLPVQGDAPQPDHIVDVQSKLLKGTPEKVRRKTYVGLTVRQGGGGNYELRVWPEKRKYSLIRRPDDDAFPVTGKDREIGKTGDANRLKLRAIGDAISGKVGKLGIGDVVDPAPRDLTGTRIKVVVGQDGRAKNGARAWFKKLRVSVPNP